MRLPTSSDLLRANATPGAPAASIAAVVLTYNRKDLLRKCLRGIQGQSRAVQEIIVVDNASIDGTPEVLRSEFPGVVHLRMAANLGPAGGFAAGLRFAATRQHDWLWCFDDDCWPDSSQSLATLLAYAEPLDDVGFVRPLLKNPYRAATGVGGGVWSGSLLAVPAIVACGVPTEEFFTEYEDQEYLYRMKSRGFQMYKCHEAAVWHPCELNTISSLIQKGSVVPPWRLYYQVRNPVYVHVRRARWRGLGRALVWGARWFMIALTFGPERLRRIRMIFNGLRDGLTGRLGPRVRPPSFIP